MNNSLIDQLNNSLSVIFSQTLNDFAMYFPRILTALIIFFFGVIVAKAVAKVMIKIFEAMKVSSLVKDTPVELFLKNADMTQKIEVFLGKIFYWIIMLVTLHTSVSILGLQPLSQVLDKLLSYLPNIFSSILILFVGVLLAGIIEGIIKGAIKSIDGKSSRLLGKISSYMVITIATMAAISELGIASEFIYILFVGFITTMTLGFGLAIGLGAKDLVKKLLDDWYKRIEKEVKE